MCDEENKETVQICRACLEPSDKTYPIFEDILESNLNIVTMFNNCSIEVGDYEEFPKTLCPTCFATLQTVHSFIKTFKKSQELLLYQYLKEHKGQIVVINEDEISIVDSNNVICDSNTEIKQLETSENDIEVMEDLENSIENPITEDLIIRNCSSDQGDSDDQDLLIEQSIQLTESYKNEKLNEEYDESESENDSKEVDDYDDDKDDVDNNHVVEKKKQSKYLTISCPVCPKTFQKFGFFSYHLSQHKGAITCNKCLVRFSDADIYLQHYQMKHRYQCKICQKSFPRGDTYRRHMQWHTNTLPRLSCTVENCTKTFAGKQALQNHYKTIHCDKHNYLCNLCGASFKNYDNLRYHMKKHKGPSHLCIYCGRAFMQAVHLTYHMWRHTGIKPYNCTHCDKSFVSKRLLVTHLRRHYNNEQIQQKEV